VKLKNKNIWCTVMILLIVAFDQITKYFAKATLYPDKYKNFIKGVVEFRYAENTGVAFSMLSGGRWIFIIITVVVTVGILVYMFTKAQKNLWLFWSLGVIASGAIGNLIDRIFLGYVIDFINPTFVNFAVFNIADCAVTLGTISLVAYLVFDMLKKEKSDE
jgi:signal peptidase II